MLELKESVVDVSVAAAKADRTRSRRWTALQTAE